ncbi:MAG: putative toxin-antitoxin system toxin component, PIN family [Burkholderiaceae bacterium]|nr:putative toxin-antitoxin system toxin component, PIN family [Burkholderiaceae bacterium]
MPRLVLDTNIVISGLILRGTPHLLMQVPMREEFAARTSYALVSELSRKLFSTKLAAQLLKRGTAAEHLIGIYAALCDVTSPAPLPTPGCRDSDDDAVLACTVAAQANLIVSGDADLLTLGQYQGIPIVTAALALQRLRAS